MYPKSIPTTHLDGIWTPSSPSPLSPSSSYLSILNFIYILLLPIICTNSLTRSGRLRFRYFYQSVGVMFCSEVHFIIILSTCIILFYLIVLYRVSFRLTQMLSRRHSSMWRESSWIISNSYHHTSLFRNIFCHHRKNVSKWKHVVFRYSMFLILIWELNLIDAYPYKYQILSFIIKLKVFWDYYSVHSLLRQYSTVYSYYRLSECVLMKFLLKWKT